MCRNSLAKKLIHKIKLNILYIIILIAESSSAEDFISLQFSFSFQCCNNYKRKYLYIILFSKAPNTQ